MSDIVKLERFAYTPFGTFGRIYIPEYQCFTVERPWLNNIPKESCIPIGEYDMKLSFYNRGNYPSYEISGVPNRTLIKVHIGNTMDDLLGCIAPGKALGFLERKWAVTSSKKAFNEFMTAMDGVETSRIHITNYVPDSV